jgi:chromosome segregation ATPase
MITNTGKDLDMGTNGTEMALEARLEEDLSRIDKRGIDNRILDAAHLRSPDATDAATIPENFVLAPLVDKIAYGIARGLVVAMKELEDHIANETRKLGDSVDRRLDTLQGSFQDLSGFVADQRSTNTAVQGRLQELTTDLRESDARHTARAEALRREAQEFSTSVTQRIEASTALLREADARRAAELAELQHQTRAFSQSASDRIDGLCKDLDVQQEDLAAIKTAVCNFAARVEALAVRLDRQADAVRSMYAAYSQRETELEQVVDGLARLRAFPTPLPSPGL